jgi:BMFP domain-containing protein YqiC
VQASAKKDKDMQTDNRILDGMARFFTNAAGAAQAFKDEMETMMKTRMERMIAKLDFVPREEFDAVKAMAAKARTENDMLTARVATLEVKLGIVEPKATATTRPAKKKKASRKAVN